ncbi:MAG: hypothetical protein F6K53_43350 [Moorea sp. SIO4A1]|nr:hypothetical protein [Moorena sp. SIO4A1]
MTYGQSRQINFCANLVKQYSLGVSPSRVTAEPGGSRSANSDNFPQSHSNAIAKIESISGRLPKTLCPIAAHVLQPRPKE